MRYARSALLVLFAWADAVSAQTPAPRLVLDDFEDVSGWSAHPADGVKLVIGSGEGVHGKAIRLDFDFERGGGYAVARKTFDVPLPADYRFRLAVRGDTKPQNFEFKLIDSTGSNVWWNNRRDFAFPARWDSLQTKKRKIEFAWGPAGGGTLGRIAAIEFAITAGSGGKGTVWLDDLVLEPLAPPPDPLPEPVIREGFANVSADLGLSRDLSGVTIRWAPGRAFRDYLVYLVDDDGRIVSKPRVVEGGDGGVDHIHLPDAEARSVRVRGRTDDTSLEGAIDSLIVRPASWAPTVNDFFARVAAEAPAGTYPRGIVGEQPYWTAIGADRDRAEALVDEDGRVEPWKQGPSLEPFLRVGPKLFTFREGLHTQSLVDGDLPIPMVRWDADASLRLTTTAVVAGDSGSASLLVRYRLENRGKARVAGTLGLALRPFQVNPPPQFLNTTGGVARVDSLAWRTPAALHVDARAPIRFVPAPARRGAATFDQGDAVAAYFAAGRLPTQETAHDPFGHASALAAYDFDLAPGKALDVVVQAAMETSSAPVPAPSVAAFEAALRAESARWRALRGPLAITLPAEGREALETFRAQLGWLRVTRDGSAVQPGARSYERSWIRDGALSSSAMLRVGEPAVAKEFADWFAQFVPADGAVPCCVDQRGPDPTPEHDSHGEFAFLVAEIVRYTGDTALAERLWPAVRRAADHITALAATRRTDEWRAPDKVHFFGLLPPSISHEGYSAKPMHSYWDDFFALKGLTDAAWLAGRLGHAADATRLSAARDTFATDFAASIRASMALHRIPYVPGCADLGDYDATSTTIALDPVQAGSVVPDSALERTFGGYWEWFERRRAGDETWDAYTPYELRTLGAMVRLGWRDRANTALDWFLRDRKPQGFRHWAEVVSREDRKPRFLGDMPHTWVGTDYVRSFVDFFAYVEAPAGADSVLVLGAGLRREWIEGKGGARIAGLPTPFGPLAYRMRRDGDAIVVEIDGGMRLPAGGIEVRPPGVPPQVTRKLPVKLRFEPE